MCQLLREELISRAPDESHDALATQHSIAGRLRDLWPMTRVNRLAATPCKRGMPCDLCIRDGRKDPS